MCRVMGFLELTQQLSGKGRVHPRQFSKTSQAHTDEQTHKLTFTPKVQSRVTN